MWCGSHTRHCCRISWSWCGRRCGAGSRRLFWRTTGRREMRRERSRPSPGCGLKVTRSQIEGVEEVKESIMRPISLVTLSLCVLAACSESNSRIDPVTVQWMDWPAEVNAAQPFRTRLVVLAVCALNPRFHPGAHADQSRRNAAGTVSLVTDNGGCVRVRPGGLYNPAAALVLEDQADTVGLSYTFVRGYIYDAAAPVCGETRVFHLTARQ